MLALTARFLANDYSGNNYAVFEYRDANGNIAFHVQASDGVRHSERLGLEYLQNELGIPSQNITRLYSERQPCDFNYCDRYVAQNVPQAEVTWSFDYAGDGRRAASRALVRQMKTILKQWGL
jgi:hypothetical protein